ncbi:ABC transporter ATP-binding protein [Pseudotamlana agarivorans]|uniref:ABC transporter ATP-binding protein n=1 Tax=Pseudotamlana agarivorans TaxID=481183 RepID=UPI00082CD2E2|nr:ABC transporter ATP-binding protein [Tamlana agarivorans]
MEKDIILKADKISKQYKLGLVGTGSINDDLKRWWYKIRGKENPFLKIGESNDRSTKGSSDYVWALQDINFEVERGEVVGIIGKNGAGKSTLLKILSKVTSPTTGEIKTKGRIASLLEVGTGFHGEMTGRENIYLNGAILGMTKKEIVSKIDEIIDFSGCQRYIDTPVKRYSSGMTVRLAFAVAAFLEPEILVIDEVLAVGDAEFQKKAIGKMQDISKGEGRTVLFVSHNMAAVKNLCSRALLLENGIITFNGNVDNCIDQYLSAERNDVVDISQYKNRQGKGHVRIIDLDVFNDKLKKINLNQFKSGYDYKFEIKVENLSSQKRDIHIGMSLFSTKGQLLTASGSEYFLEKIYIDGKEIKVIKLSIPSLPLTEGEYVLNLSCKSDLNGLEDFIKDSLIINVENIISTERNITKFPREMIQINHDWSQ